MHKNVMEDFLGIVITYPAICAVIYVKFVVNPICAESVIAARQEELYATEGTQVTLGCDTVEKQPIAYCRFLTPRLLGFAVDEKSDAQSPPRYAYSGQGLTAGHCGLSVNRVDDSDYGNWTCAVKILDSTGSEEVSTTVLLRKPEGIYYITLLHINNMREEEPISYIQAYRQYSDCVRSTFVDNQFVFSI